MNKSSLLEILRTFSKQELIKFEDLVRSPYFNKKENVTKLFLEIKKFAPEFTNENLDKEKVWMNIFPGKEYNYGIMKNLIFDLSKLSESFLCEEIYKDNEMQRSLDLLTSIFSRNADIFQNKMESTKRTFRKNFETNNYKYAHEFYKQFGNIFELNANFSHQQSTQKKNRDDLRFASEYNTYNFLLNCFRIFHKLMVHDHDLNQSPEDNLVFKLLKIMDDSLLLKAVLDHSIDTSVKDHKLLKANYLMFKAFRSNQNKEAYGEFKNYIFENSSDFSKDEIKSLHVSLLSCLTNLKTTTNEFYNEYFGIIQMGFKDKVMLNSDGSITYQVFFSIVNVSCGANETEFAENFINKYKDKLPSHLREAIYNYSMAQLNFTLRRNEKALEFLSFISDEPWFLKFSIKNLQLSIYYELDNRDAFDYSFDTFKHFIRKNKLTNESRIITQTQYCNYIKLLFRLREKPDAFALSELKKEITVNKVINKRWLLEKIEALEKSKS
jgi:hypothetical protein